MNLRYRTRTSGLSEYSRKLRLRTYRTSLVCSYVRVVTAQSTKRVTRFFLFYRLLFFSLSYLLNHPHSQSHTTDTMRNVSKLIFQSLLPCLFYLAYNAAAKAILGVDLGSLYMKVALVQRNSPLEIVTNLHSKRKTEQLILFDRGTRFYGADASSVMARKPLQAPEAMSIMLGRGDDHPFVQVRKNKRKRKNANRGVM